MEETQGKGSKLNIVLLGSTNIVGTIIFECRISENVQANSGNRSTNLLGSTAA